jgi:putative flavoprotein involved in K+ transport
VPAGGGGAAGGEGRILQDSPGSAPILVGGFGSGVACRSPTTYKLPVTEPALTATEAVGTPRPLPATAPAVVIGAGPAGLSVAAELRRRGVLAINLDRAQQVGNSWRGHYDRLRLHTVRWLSNLPGYRFPRSYGPWVARDDVIRYLEDYSRNAGIDLVGGTTVRRIDRDGAGWVVRTDRGEVRSPVVVVATGHNHTPHLHDWPGREGFTGTLLHARDYRNGGPYEGKDVLVVGAGNTGAEIAVDLVEHGAGTVRLAVRTPPHVMRRSAGGVPTTLVSVVTRYVPPRVADPIAARMQKLTVGDLTEYGLPQPEIGIYSNLRANDQVPILDVGLVDAVKKGTVGVVAAVQGFDGADVLLADGSRLSPDVVIAATGYDHGLEPLVGHLGLLDGQGRPTVRGAATAPGAPGLYFTGYTNPISGMFRELAIDARRIARAVAGRK